MRDFDDSGRSDHALHAGHCRGTSYSSNLHRRRAAAFRPGFSSRGGSVMTRLLPFPLVSAGLLIVWLLLNQALSVGHVLLGGAVALAGGWALAALRPPKARVRRPAAIFRLSSLVLADIVRSNI